MTRPKMPGANARLRRWGSATASGAALALLLAGCGGAQPAQAPDAEPTAASQPAAQAPDAESTPADAAPLVASPASTPAPSEEATATGATPEAALAACWPDGAVGAAAATTEGGQVGKQYPSAPAMAIDTEKTYTATLTTNKGDIEVQFFPAEAPNTVNNFVCLARDGYYDGTPFHRIVSGFVVQGGDPTGTGSGGPGYRFADEAVTRRYTKGTLAMANAGPNTNGSQFFIVTGADVGLPPAYTIFGEVTAGMDVVDALASTPTRAGASGEKSTPTEPVTLERVTVTEN